MRLLSKELVSQDYLDHLRQDLARATVCRFQVAYVSSEGIQSIGRHLLSRALREPRSFGVSSLSCSCGHEPLLRLQRELGDTVGLHLKYFMDPLVSEPGSHEPDKLALFHSKLVYLAQERDRKSVVYLGSHNWTRRALGPGGPRNAEASLRLEIDFEPEHLTGTGPSLASEVNRHLLDAYNLPACLPATPDNEGAFKQWYEIGCHRSRAAALDEVTVVLAVRKADGTSAPPHQWENLAGGSIYLQALEESEGQSLWNKLPILVLVWDSEADLRAGNQPVLLRCRVTTSKAGPNSRLHGTNQSTAPVAGFQAVIFDEDQLAAMLQGATSGRSSVRIWSRRNVEIYDFEFPTQRVDSSQVDGGRTPRYQFYLEVERVVFPVQGNRPENPRLAWSRETFAVAKSKNDARVEEIPGYQVKPEEEKAILSCLAETLLIDPDRAKVLPVSDYDRAKVGKRIAHHPLHETFIGEATKRSRDEFYRKAQPGTLVAELDDPQQPRNQEHLATLFIDEPLERVQRVFTTPLSDLEEIWAATARQFQPQQPGGDSG